MNYKNLEFSLMAIPLVAHNALTTVYINDVDSFDVFVQQLFGYGREGDVFLGISASCNSKNIINAIVVTGFLVSRLSDLPERKAANWLWLQMLQWKHRR